MLDGDFQVEEQQFNTKLAYLEPIVESGLQVTVHTTLIYLMLTEVACH